MPIVLGIIYYGLYNSIADTFVNQMNDMIIKYTLMKRRM